MQKHLIKTGEDLEYVTAPVFVDSMKKDRDFKMTRLSFLVIDYEDDQINWNKELERRKIPFITMGPYCVVCKPFGKKEKFHSKDMIKNLFNQIEDENFLIESNYIWLPNNLLKREPKRGDVYRVNIPLLMKGYQYSNNKISEADFFKFCKKNKEHINYEELETKAFHSWNKERISKSIAKHKELYDKSKEDYHKKYLRWKED